MSRIEILGDTTSTYGKYRIVTVCCNRYKKEVEKDFYGRPNLLNESFEYCPFCGEGLIK